MKIQHYFLCACVRVYVCVRARACAGACVLVLVCLLGLVKYLRKTTKNSSTDGCQICDDMEPDTFCLRPLLLQRSTIPQLS